MALRGRLMCWVLVRCAACDTAESFLVPPQIPLPDYSKLATKGDSGRSHVNDGHRASRCSIGSNSPRMSIQSAAESLRASPHSVALHRRFGDEKNRAAMEAASGSGSASASTSSSTPPSSTAGGPALHHAVPSTNPLSAHESPMLHVTGGGTFKLSVPGLDPAELHLLLDIMARGERSIADGKCPSGPCCVAFRHLGRQLLSWGVAGGIVLLDQTR